MEPGPVFKGPAFFHPIDAQVATHLNDFTSKSALHTVLGAQVVNANGSTLEAQPFMLLR